MQFDERSEHCIATLLPEVQPYARAHLAACLAAGLSAKIISGNRTYAEQDALFAKGRSVPGAKVTNARGGQSNHNFGLAYDLGLWSGADYLEDSPLYDRAGAIGKGIGLEWGGDWHSIQDKPHFQLPTGKTLSEMREDIADGRSVLSGVTLPPLPTVASSWKLLLHGADIGPLQPGPNDPGHNYVEARPFLCRFYAESIVSTYLGSSADGLTWRGTVIQTPDANGNPPHPIPTFVDAAGHSWVQIAAVCDWLGVTLTVDAETHTITVERP